MIGVQQIAIKGGHGNRAIDMGLFNWTDDENAKGYFLDMLKNGGLIHNFSPTEVLVVETSRLDKIEEVLFSGKQKEMRFLYEVAAYLSLYFDKVKETAKEISDNPDAFEALKALRHI